VPGAAPRTAHPGLLGGLPPARRGAAIYLVASLVFIVTDSLAKVIVADVPIVFVVFGRNLAYLATVLLLLSGREPGRLLRTSRPWTQVARGLLLFGSTATWFWALSLLPLAEASTLASTAPLITVAIAGPLLGERVTRTAIVGSCVGFVGVLLIVGLDPTQLQLAVVVPLANAGILALFYVLTRDLRHEPPAVTMFWSGAVPLAASAILLMVVPTTRAPTPTEWAGIGVVGVLAWIAHRLLVAAYRWSRASDLAPLGYLGVLWAFVLGAVVFSEPASVQSIVGAVAIAMGGIIVLRAPNGAGDEGDAPAEYAVPVVEPEEAGPFGEPDGTMP
jgi:drug/metabolite transporter (DMT)-like permease